MLLKLSFDVMNFQTISKLKNSKPTYESVSKYVQIYRSYISPNQKFGAKCFKKLPEIRQIAKQKYL